MTRYRATPLNGTSLDAIAPKRIDALARPLDDELMVYDARTHRGHCLNQTAAAVWMACDGRTTITKITRDLQETVNSGIDQRVVWLALTKLENAGLLLKGTAIPDEFRGLSRREALRKIGVAGAIALPVISSVLVPTPVHATSCLAVGQVCSSNLQCCSHNCGLLSLPPHVCL
jgi:hypothetical protein